VADSQGAAAAGSLGRPDQPGPTIGPVALLERDGFLDELDGLLGEAARGHGRLVLVRGEAGIGKTTLAEAFGAGRAGRFWWGTCDPAVSYTHLTLPTICSV